MTERYKVDGMTCGGCAKSMTNAITRLAPEAVVQIDVETGIVTVSGATEAQVRDASDAAGFDFVGQAA